MVKNFYSCEMSLEKLELDVAVKLAAVNKSLTSVEEYQKQLQENAQKVKEDIHDAVDRQVGSLRGRERQLVRQVEVVTAYQNCLLNTQQAGLMHSQGALSATKNLLDRCTSVDVTTLSKIKMDDIAGTRNIRPVNLVSVQLNESALSSAIGAFGSVQLPETITHHPSPVIPAKVEEYEDEDHDVLHKSVAGAASGPDSPVRVTVQFPRLNQQNWLIGQKGGNGSVYSSSSKIQKIGESKCNVTSWLSNLQISGAQDEEDNAPTPSSIGSFDLMSNYESTPVLSSRSSSIEIVPSRFDSDKEEDCSTMGSSCEIENLPTCLDDKSRWLSPRHMPSKKFLLQKIRLSDACQANEPCADFSECVCKGNCIDSALEKAKQSAAFRAKSRRKRTISEVYGSNPILSHMAYILSSDNSNWLFKSSDSQAFIPGLAKKAMYEAPGEKWLSSSKSSASLPPPSRVILSTHSNIWLLHKLKSEKGKIKEEKDVRENNMVTENAGNNKFSNCELTEKFREFAIDQGCPKKIGGHAPQPSSYDLSSNATSGNRVNSSHHIDNKMLEDDKSRDLALVKMPWLACSLLSNIDVKMGDKKSHTLPESVLGVAQANLDSWLMKRL